MSERNDSTLSSKLRGLRESTGLTQLQMANELDVNPSTVFRWETGKSEPKVRHLQRLHHLAKQFQVRLDIFSDQR